MTIIGHDLNAVLLIPGDGAVCAVLGVIPARLVAVGIMGECTLANQAE